jgi:hypothetical protein
VTFAGTVNVLAPVVVSNTNVGLYDVQRLPLTSTVTCLVAPTE